MAEELDDVVPLRGGQYPLSTSYGNDMKPLRLTFREKLARARETGALRCFGLAVAASILLAFILLALLAAAASNNITSLDTTALEEHDAAILKFLVVGDWGRRGHLNQTSVANWMARKAKHMQPDFVISTGDNFYPAGLRSTHDYQFNISFSSVYKQPALQLPWYAVLGNHDYGDGRNAENEGEDCPHKEGTNGTAHEEECQDSPLHELNPHLQGHDSRWHCQRSYKLGWGDGAIEIFFLDTSPFVAKYMDAPWANNPGGLKEQTWEANLAELRANLEQSAAVWKLVVGHHPVYSNGEHGNTTELVEHLQPILQEHGVQAYFCGHDHNLEHIRMPQQQTQYIISGGGSKCDRGMQPNSNAVFQWPYSGFVACQVMPKKMMCDFITPGQPSLKPQHIATVPLSPLDEEVALDYDWYDYGTSP